MILTRLEQEEGFTAAERAAARFIRANPHDVLEMSLSDLSAHAHTSQATIVRMCKKLGCSGYPAFKLRLAAEFDTSLRDVEPIDVDVPFGPNASHGDILNAFYSLTYQTVRSAKTGLDEHLLTRAANAIHRADLVTFYGRGESLLVAENFRQKLMRIGMRCNAEVLNGFEGGHAPRKKCRELAFVVSQYANSNQIYNIFDELMFHRTPIIMLCGMPTAPLTRLADIALTVDVPETRYKIGSFASRTAMMYVLDCLFGIIFAMDYERNVKNLQDLYGRNSASRLYVE